MSDKHLSPAYGTVFSVALITVTETEEAGLRAQYKNWRKATFPGDKQVYYETVFERDGRNYDVVTARQNEFGMIAGATLAMKLIQRYKPRYLIMVGIAAGIARPEVTEQLYGDVIVANKVWHYTSGKFVSPDKAEISFGGIGFIPRPTSKTISPEIERYVRMAAESPENQCHVHIGPMACGTGVVANKVIHSMITSQLSDTAGLDMESYAIAYAAENAIEPRPYPLIIKSVCDYADSTKDDRYQKFAAFTSAEFAKLLYEKFLPV